eukprot:2327533-Pleurochrysis_carterae.AAC.2
MNFEGVPIICYNVDRKRTTSRQEPGGTVKAKDRLGRQEQEQKAASGPKAHGRKNLPASGGSKASQWWFQLLLTAYTG